MESYCSIYNLMIGQQCSKCVLKTRDTPEIGTERAVHPLCVIGYKLELLDYKN